MSYKIMMYRHTDFTCLVSILIYYYQEHKFYAASMLSFYILKKLPGQKLYN